MQGRGIKSKKKRESLNSGRWGKYTMKLITTDKNVYHFAG